MPQNLNPSMRNIDVCLSPELIHKYDIKHKIVVVTDVLRATSCIVTALAHKADHIIPMTTEEGCKKIKQQGYIIAGEKNGKKIDGFDKGNSPFEYMGEELKGTKIALKTTNGTVAIERSKQAYQLIIGSFLNLSAVADYLATKENDILVLCAGWKGLVNTEDSLFAGALVDALKKHTVDQCDASMIAQQLYLSCKHHVLDFLSASSHIQRLQRLQHDKDIKFCLTPNQYHIIPILKKGCLTL